MLTAEEERSRSLYNTVRLTFFLVMAMTYCCSTTERCKMASMVTVELWGTEVSQISGPNLSILSGGLSAVNLFFRVCGGKFWLGPSSKPIS